MAPAKKNFYSVILPTFNERQNLPVVAWLLNRTFTEQYVKTDARRKRARQRVEYIELFTD